MRVVIPIIFLSGLMILRFVLAAYLPLSPDEAYYWLWSKNLQSGYFDHPFMVALWIRLGTILWRDGFFGIRFLGPLAAAIGTALLFKTALRIYAGDKKRAIYAAFLLNGTIMFGFGMVIMTPDTPLLFFTILSLWGLVESLEASTTRKRVFWWSFTGLSLGLAFDSKYTACFLVAGIGLYVLLQKRDLLRQVSFWLGVLVASLTISPILIWNAHYQWVGLLKQGSRIGDWHPERAFTYVGELLGGQIGLATPLVALVCFTGFLKARKKIPLLFWLILPGLVILLLHACGGRVQANWPAVLYPAFVLAGAFIMKARLWVVGTSFMFMLGLVLQGLYAPLSLSAHWDPVARQTKGWHDLTNTLITRAKEEKCQALFVQDYALASILAYHDSNGYPIISPDKRWHYLGERKITSLEKVLSVSEERPSSSKEGRTAKRYFRNRVLRSYLLKDVAEAQGYVVR